MREEFEGPNLSAVLEAASRRAACGVEQLRYQVLSEERGFLGAETTRIRVLVELLEGAGAPARSRPQPRARRGPTQPGRDSPQPRRAARAGDEEREARQGEPEGEGAGGEREEPRDRDEDDREDLVSDEVRSGPDPSAGRVHELVKELVSHLQLDGAVEMSEDEERILINISGADRELLTERRGELIDALQYLTNRMARRRFDTYKRVQLEADGFRSGREDELRELARDAAERVRSGGEPVRLPPLNPYERRIVHLFISQQAGLSSESEGDGFVKRIVVRGQGRRDGFRRGRGGRDRDRGRRQS